MGSCSVPGGEPGKKTKKMQEQDDKDGDIELTPSVAIPSANGSEQTWITEDVPGREASAACGSAASFSPTTIH